MRQVWSFPLFFAVALTACSDDTVTEADPRDIAFDASLDIDLDRMTETSTGLFYEDVTVGTGEVAAAGDEVTTLYSGWLPDGTLFDTTDDNGVPITFTLGVRDVIDGWDEGIAGMRSGGVRKLVIPPSLGYGPGRNGPIPGNSVLVFRVELVGVEKDG